MFKLTIIIYCICAVLTFLLLDNRLHVHDKKTDTRIDDTKKRSSSFKFYKNSLQCLLDNSVAYII